MNSYSFMVYNVVLLQKKVMWKYYKNKCFNISFPLLHSWVDKSIIFLLIIFCHGGLAWIQWDLHCSWILKGFNYLNLKTCSSKRFCGVGKKKLAFINSSEERASRHKVLFSNEAYKKYSFLAFYLCNLI